MICPLCLDPRKRPSWLGSTWYLDREFTYSECCGCGSLYCDPMPDSVVLNRMYGPQYATGFENDLAITDPKEPQRVMDWLKRVGPGLFIDYGCGSGSLLIEASNLNWHPVGVELDVQVARRVQAQTGCRVISDPTILSEEYSVQADVLHLGDVIEHLTDLDQQMPQILSLVKPGGLLIAQGPLEANPNLFTIVLRAARQLRPKHRTEMAPYHVLLATGVGQRTLFRRFGLQEVEYSVHEVAWPAPSRLPRRDLKKPRAIALYTLRRSSQFASGWRPGKWGNRYFYAGQWNG